MPRPWRAGSVLPANRCASLRRLALWCAPGAGSTGLRTASGATAKSCEARPHDAGGEASLEAMRAERVGIAREQREALALKNAAMRGELLDAGEVEARWSSILRLAMPVCARSSVTPAPPIRNGWRAMHWHERT